MKNFLKTLMLTAMVLLALQAFAQLLKITDDNGNTNHAPDSKTPIRIEEGLVQVSVTPSGEVSLSSEDLLQLNVDLPTIDAETESESPELIPCHCFGKMDRGCYPPTGAIGGNYSWPCKTKAHENDCCQRVLNYFANLSAAQKQSIETCLCNAGGIANGTTIGASGAVGTGGYQSCGPVATFHQTPAYSVTTCTCPPGWLANPTNIDGGVTTDGKCKKGVCGWDAAVYPGFPQTVAIGTWGFTWQNGIYAWGTAANGGEADCVTICYPAGPCTVSWP